MESLLFGVPPLDPVSFAAAAALLFAVALAASYLPARRRRSRIQHIPFGRSDKLAKQADTATGHQEARSVIDVFANCPEFRGERFRQKMGGPVSDRSAPGGRQ